MSEDYRGRSKEADRQISRYESGKINRKTLDSRLGKLGFQYTGG